MRLLNRTAKPTTSTPSSCATGSVRLRRKPLPGAGRKASSSSAARASYNSTGTRVQARASLAVGFRRAWHARIPGPGSRPFSAIRLSSIATAKLAPTTWPAARLSSRRNLVVASLRRREVRRVGRHRPAKLTHGSSQFFPRRLARADVCPRRANVAALTSAVVEKQRDTHVPT